MHSREIEIWALRVIKQAQSTQPSEDKLTELKREWPTDHYKAARRIAGHANAAGGEPILWLIGVDQQRGAVIGASHQEFSKWLAVIGSHFEGLVPRCQDLNITVNSGLTVVALVFDSMQAPYVVRNQEFGISKSPISYEVPFRKGTSVVSANRSDLLLILAEKRSMRSLLGEMEWNIAVAARADTDHAQFRDEEFQKTLISGSLSELGEGLKAVVMEAYLAVSSAQSQKGTLATTVDGVERARFSGQVNMSKAAALRALSKALQELRVILEGK